MKLKQKEISKKAAQDYINKHKVESNNFLNNIFKSHPPVWVKILKRLKEKEEK